MLLLLRWLPVTLVLLLPLGSQAGPLPGPQAQAELHRRVSPIRQALRSVRALPQRLNERRLRPPPVASATSLRQKLGRQLSQPLRRSSELFAQQGVGELSTASLLWASANQTFRLGAAGARFAGPLSGVGSLGLGLHSCWRLARADSHEKKVEALHGLAWSLQGMRGLGYLLRDKGAWIEPASQGFGVAGGALQTYVGLRRIVHGWRAGQRASAIAGGLDVGAGLCWAASSLSWANPYSLGGFIGFTLAQMAYNRRDTLKRVGQGCARKVGRGVAKVRQHWQARRERRAQASLKPDSSPYAAMARQLAGDPLK